MSKSAHKKQNHLRYVKCSFEYIRANVTYAHISATASGVPAGCD